MNAKILWAISMLLAVFPSRLSADDSLVGRWPFDEGTGTNTVDVSGHEHTGWLIGATQAVWTAGVSSNALSFDGVQNAVVVDDASALTPSNALTLTAWVKTEPFATGEIIAKWSTNGNGGSYMLSLTNGCVALELSLNGQYNAVVGEGTCLTDTNWHHVAGTYDGGAMAVYFDAQLAGSAMVSGTVGTVGAPLRFGFVPSLVDEVRVYGESLTTNQITALYNADLDGDGFPDRLKANPGAEQSHSGSRTNLPATVSAPAMISMADSSGCITVTPGSSGVLWGAVFQGCTYTYDASGTVHFNENGATSDPDGNISTNGISIGQRDPAGDGFLCPSLKGYSLVARIDDGDCIQLGSDGSFTAASTGCLKLYFNDDVWNDNSGFWDCCITESGTPTIPPCTPTISVANPIVFVNADDDDGDGIPDKDNYGWWYAPFGDNDTVALNLNAGAALSCMNATLSVTPASPAGHVLVWDPVGWRVLIDNASNTSVSWSAGEMPPTVYLIGIDASTDVDDVTLSLQLDCNETPATTTITVVDVVSTEWEQVTSELYENIGPGSGVAIFPDRPSPTATSRNYDQVRVKATIQPALSGISIYFTSFDVDDPSSSEAPVDAEGVDEYCGGAPTDIDNRGAPWGGHLEGGTEPLCTGNSKASATTDANGTASRLFTVSKQPGDNYRVVANPLNNFGAGYHAVQAVNDGTISTAGWYPQSIPTQYTTDMLTVWRHLWVERDTMSPSDIEAEAVSANVVQNSIQPSEILANQFSGSSFEYADSVYEGGQIYFYLYNKQNQQVGQYGPFCVKNNQTVSWSHFWLSMKIAFCRSLTNTEINDMKSAHHVKIKMWDDDYANLLSDPQTYVVDGDPFVPTAYREAYIQTSYVDTPTQGNTVPNRSFIRRVSYWDLIWNIKATLNIASTEDRWASLVVSGFEPGRGNGNDADPDKNYDGCNFASTCGPWPTIIGGEDTPSLGATPPGGKNWSVIFFETRSEVDSKVGVTMAHEMGHAADLGHRPPWPFTGQNNLMHWETGAQEDNPHFDADDLNALRGKSNW